MPTYRELKVSDRIKLVAKSASKAITAAGAGLLGMGTFLAYRYVFPSAGASPSNTLLWAVIWAGFALTLIGLTTLGLQVSRRQRRSVAVYLFVSGIAAFAGVVLLAHIGFLLLIMAVPALVCSVVLGIMATIPSSASAGGWTKLLGGNLR